MRTLTYIYTQRHEKIISISAAVHVYTYMGCVYCAHHCVVAIIKSYMTFSVRFWHEHLAEPAYGVVNYAYAVTSNGIQIYWS